MTHLGLRGERAALSAGLTDARQHVLGVLDGLDDEALRRPTLPSGWSCLGLVRHLALDDERFWFRGVIAGERTVIDAVHLSADNAWRVAADVPAQEVLGTYRREIGHADEIMAGVDLDAAPAWWPAGLFGEWRLHTVREVVFHVLIETACHAGHLDAARELIDGRLWLALT
ncbi:MAG: DinB family protein [Mycobacteriales bacterium]